MPSATVQPGATLRTFHFTREKGWSCGSLPQLDSERTLVVAFASPEFAEHPAPLRELARHFPNSCLVGCSTSGEIAGTRLHDGTVTVAAMRFARTRLQRLSAPVERTSSFATGQMLARELPGPELRAVFVLAEGLGINGSELVRGFNRELPPSVVVTGGLAGDGPRFVRTWVLDGGAPVAGRVCAVGFHGDAVRVGHGSKGGWDAFGPERRVTRSTANVLHELDGKPALQLYEQCLGDRASGLPATGLLFPLSLRAPDRPQMDIVRTLLAVDAASQSMTFAGDLPEGHYVRFMRANFDRLIEGSAQAAGQSLVADASGPVLAIAVSCIGRRLVLGERAEEEIEAAFAALPSGSQQVGYYSYGELSPFATGQCSLHNQTMTLTTFAEC